MKKIFLLTLIVVLTVSFTFAGCGAKDESAQKSETQEKAAVKKADEPTKTEEKAEYNPADNPLAIVMILKGHPVHRIVQLGFLEKAKELGYSAEVVASEGAEPAESIALGEAAVGKGVKGMLVWAFDQSYYPFINKSNSKGVKCVVPHFPIPEGDCEGLSANLSADPYGYGQSVAKAIGDEVKGKEGCVAVTQGSFNLTENAATKGFTDYINENYTNLKVLDAIEEGFDAPQAIAKISAIIQGNPDILGGFGTTGGSPVTWSGAMAQTGREDIIAIGMDYTEQNIDLVKQGKIYGIVAQPLYEEASISAVILDKLLRGEDVPYFTPLEAPVVTKDGIDKYGDIINRVKEWFK